MVTEILFGQIFTLLDSTKNWKKIKIEDDGYEGWIEFSHGFQKNDGARKICKNKGYLETSTGVVLIYIGAELTTDQSLKTIFHSDNSGLIEIAKSFLSTPYLWGGKTQHGIDCSGFIQVVFSSINIKLPRDAFQQAEIGITIQHSDAKQGDLAFFKNENGKITHVGLLISQSEIIHSSEMVRIDQLTDNGIYNRELDKMTHHLSHIKRVK